MLVNPIHFLVTYLQNSSAVTVREMGGNVARVTPDGLVLLFGGQTLQFTGASKVNVDTGEVLLEPHHSLDAQIAEVCALYTS